MCVLDKTFPTPEHKNCYLLWYINCIFIIYSSYLDKMTFAVVKAVVNNIVPAFIYDWIMVYQYRNTLCSL